MGLIHKFEIEFVNNPPVYCEGDTLAGHVSLITTEDIRCKCIRLELHGVSVVHWTRLCLSHKDHKEQSEPDHCKTRANVIHEEYSEKIIFLEKDGSFLGKDRVLTPGEHIFPFSIRLPCELPSSFEGEYGQVRYTASALIERSGFKSNIACRRAFTVLTGLDLSFIPEAMTKIEICKYKKLGRLRGEGAVTIDWVVNRSGFVPGEEIPIGGSIQNDSRQTVLNSSVALFMVILYKARRKWKKERRKIVDHEKGTTRVGDVTIWNEALLIPPLPPTGLNRSKVIDISYELEFIVSIAGGNPPVTYTKQIYIGTVPISGDSMTRSYATMLRHNYSAQLSAGDDFHGGADNPYSSLPSLTDAIAAAAITGVVDINPSAPSLTTLRRESWSVESAISLPDDIIKPPPFAPGHYDDESLFDDSLLLEDETPHVCEPSAPSENTLLRPWSAEQQRDKLASEVTSESEIESHARAEDNEVNNSNVDGTAKVENEETVGGNAGEYEDSVESDSRETESKIGDNDRETETRIEDGGEIEATVGDSDDGSRTTGEMKTENKEGGFQPVYIYYPTIRREEAAQ